MFLRSVKNVARVYLKCSAYTAGVAGIGMAAISLPHASQKFGDGVKNSKAHSKLGLFADGIRESAPVLGNAAAVGAMIGGAPVTYPLFKLSERVYRQFKP